MAKEAYGKLPIRRLCPQQFLITRQADEIL